VAPHQRGEERRGEEKRTSRIEYPALRIVHEISRK